MDIKISKNVKISPNFLQNSFFLDSYNTELSENDDSTRDSKYIRNYMRPDFAWCQKIVLYETMPKWSHGLLIFLVD